MCIRDSEVCVDAFCAGDLEFSGIVEVVGDVVADHLAQATSEPLSVAAVLAADAAARAAATNKIKGA
jgi:1-deoxy-D-xylulose-5-phosphate reductoisomerase